MINIKRVACIIISLLLAFGVFSYSSAESEEQSFDELIAKLNTPGMFVSYARLFFVGIDEGYDYSDIELVALHNWHVMELVLKRTGYDYTYKELSQKFYLHRSSTHIVSFIVASDVSASEAKMLCDTWAQVVREFCSAKMDMREPNFVEEGRYDK